ncbi:MAG: hypothetical protein DME61_11640 [Verrucomicrobia bacterium]|nr:MAG: hypothetical protein DME61_11640 [Verrucomicrobiota bacterium]
MNSLNRLLDGKPKAARSCIDPRRPRLLVTRSSGFPPPQLRGWLALRDQFIHAPDQKTVRYIRGHEAFLFRF